MCAVWDGVNWRKIFICRVIQGQMCLNIFWNDFLDNQWQLYAHPGIAHIHVVLTSRGGVHCLHLISGPKARELQHLWQQLGLTNEEVIDVWPIVHYVDHYFVVVADYEENVMYVFGQHIALELAGVYLQDKEDWGKWHGNCG
jgi:hypothetical protein